MRKFQGLKAASSYGILRRVLNALAHWMKNGITATPETVRGLLSRGSSSAVPAHPASFLIRRADR